MKRLAVIGANVTNSLSPLLHNEFAKLCDINLIYEHLSIEESSLEKYLKLLGDYYCGFNITNPYKQKVISILNNNNFNLSDKFIVQNISTQNLIPINTLVAKNNYIYAYNTDGAGIVKDIVVNNKFVLKEKSVVILGTGGACLGVAIALANENLKSITIVGRHKDKAKDIVSAVKQIKNNKSPFMQSSTFADIYLAMILENTDLIINATSCGHLQDLPQLPLDLNLANCYCYDLNYGKASISFAKWSCKNKANFVSNGVGMLIEQGAIAFQHWFDILPETKSVIEKFNKMSIM